MDRGKFVVLEGGEGSGKTTILNRLKETSAVRDGRIKLTREPGGSEFGEQIRNILFSEQGKTFNAQTQFHLFFAGRTDHVEKIVAPALEQGIHVVSDRFAASTFAHQIFGEGHHDLKLLFRTSTDMLKRWIVPPTYIYLDIEPELGLARKGKALDGNHYDNRGLDYHHRVRQGYREFACHARVVEIDASRSHDEVWQDFCDSLDKALA